MARRRASRSTYLRVRVRVRARVRVRVRVRVRARVRARVRVRVKVIGSRSTHPRHRCRSGRRSWGRRGARRA